MIIAGWVIILAIMDYMIVTSKSLQPLIFLIAGPA